MDVKKKLSKIYKEPETFEKVFNVFSKDFFNYDGSNEKPTNRNITSILPAKRIIIKAYKTKIKVDKEFIENFGKIFQWMYEYNSFTNDKCTEYYQFMSFIVNKLDEHFHSRYFAFCFYLEFIEDLVKFKAYIY